MEQRYQIGEPVGQGGMGTVFRAMDTRMNREVAVKRIRSNGDEAAAEASSRMLQEAGALASFQHPHIVTVYDVGSDDEGPYVVMEFINGKPLDTLVDRAPLTWQDFRELAVQTQEALIAAQERSLIHRDIKPSNLMLTWLPSGKFQIKIVDFGLATLVQEAALENLENQDSVFGSIYFMCPEQFERATLDARADIYSMGCVYYYALTQDYPFSGATGMEVMTAHLHHSVIPLQNLRPDLPRWVCDWVMWQINRQPADRPADSRECLKVFIQNDASDVKSAASPAPAPAPAVPRSRLIIPGGPRAAPLPPQPPPPVIPEPPRTQTAPQPLAPPEGSLPSVHASPEPSPPPAVVVPEPSATQSTVPSSRLVMTGKPPMRGPSPPATGGVHAPAEAAYRKLPPTVAKPRMGTPAKTAIAVALGLLVLGLAWFLTGKSKENKQAGRYNAIMKLVADDAGEIPVSKDDFEMLLRTATDPSRVENREAVSKAIVLAKAKDGSDLDGTLVDYVTRQPMAPDIRRNLIAHVVRKRNNPSVVPALLDYCRSVSDPAVAIAALEACRFMAGGKELPKFIGIVEYNDTPSISQAAEANALEILKSAANREAIGGHILSAQPAASGNARYALTRLAGAVGGKAAAEIIKKSLVSDDAKERAAAIMALGNWPDDSMFPTLVEQIGSQDDPALRARAFDAAYQFLMRPDRKRAPASDEGMWKALAAAAKTEADQIRVISGVTHEAEMNHANDKWAEAIASYFVDQSAFDKVKMRGEDAVFHIRSRSGTKNGNGGN